MARILVVGCSGHGKVVLDVLARQGCHEVAGLLDDGKPVGTRALDYAVLGSVPDAPRLAAQLSIDGLLVAIGDNFIRAKVVSELERLLPTTPFVTAVHPSAQLGSGVTIGAGTVVMAGVSINPDTQIGRFCIINTNSSVDHDSRVDDYASLAPRVVTGGNVAIGAFSAVSIGAIVLHGRKVGEHSVLGAGAVARRDVEPFTVAYGVPARTIRTRKAGDRYL